MNNNEIKFNQTLHGYLDGHTLISSSIELDSEVKLQMLPLSDLSGASIEKGFEEYITGYPLKEANMYALGKTWYAPEMRRPGCVWTHTLLINFSDLSRVCNIGALLELFRRPDSKEFVPATYTVPISAPQDINLRATDDHLIHFPTHNLHLILQYLYGGEEQPVFVRTNSSAEMDWLFLKLWGQQWPRLRRNFSFCSGSIAPRTYKGKFLDLQNLPESSDILRNLSAAVNIQIVDKNQPPQNVSDEKVQEWVKFAGLQLFSPSEEFRSFFNLFGSDLSIRRSSFRHLVNAYMYFLKEKPELEACVQFLGNEFPGAKEASNLKAVILNAIRSPFPNFLPQYDEKAILYILSTTNLDVKFDFQKLNYKQRFVDYFKIDTEHNFSLLKQIIMLEPNVWGEAAITELAQSIDSSSVFNFLLADKQLASIFIKLNPKLALNHNFWLINQSTHGEILAQLTSANLDTHEWEQILDTLIEIGSDVDPTLFDDLQLNPTSRILEKMNRQGFLSINPKWIHYLDIHPNEILQWIAQKDLLSTEILFAIINFLNPNSPITISYGLDPWLRYLQHAESMNSDKHLQIHAFLVALAFNIHNVKAQRTFELCFEHVYFSLYNDKLDYDSWKSIELHTTSLSFWKDWDKCKKLVNALVDIYIRLDWPIKKLIQQINDDHLADRIAAQYKKRR